MCALLWVLTFAAAIPLPGFNTSGPWGEQIQWLHPLDDVRVLVVAPNREKLDPSLPTSLVFYALPNGNTIEMTEGCANATGLYWRYLIQQIGAQMRQLRSDVPARNFVLAYLEAKQLSWPAWRVAHSNYRVIIPEIMGAVNATLPLFVRGANFETVLSSHSGGGSFMFGFLDASPSIAGVQRLVFLDSDYDYDETPAYGDSLVKWLQGSSSHHLSIICYDDRNITLNGHKVTPPDGGTYRHTHHLITRLMQEPSFNIDFVNSSATQAPIQAWTGLPLGNGGHQIDIRLHLNPANIILHTVLVWKNGFIHGMTSGTPDQDKAGVLFGGLEYSRWISAPANASCPEGMLLVWTPTTGTASCIDQYEAHVVKVNPNGTESPWEFNVPLDGITARAKVKAGVRPQAYVSAVQAKAACAEAGKRLCGHDEWLAACRGPSRNTFPYGPSYHAGWCNEGRPENPVTELFGPDATFNFTEMNDPRLDLLSNTVAKGGAFPECVSDIGTFDQSGNLDEWVADLVPSNGHGIFEGGFFVDAKINGPGCMYRTVAHAPTYHDYSLGFRCCSDVK